MAENKGFSGRIASLKTNRFLMRVHGSCHRSVTLAEWRARFWPTERDVLAAANLSFPINLNTDEKSVNSVPIFNRSSERTQNHSPQSAIANKRQRPLHADERLNPSVKGEIERQYRKTLTQHPRLGPTNVK